MSFDAIFEQPEIIADLDDLTFEVTTYPATATRTGSTWTVSVHDLPGGHSVSAEGTTWLEAEYAVQDRVPARLGVDRASVVVSVKPADPQAHAALHALTAARIARAKAEQAERDAARHAARLLTAQGWSPQDAGMALRLPAERVLRLVASAPGRAG